MSYQGHIQVLCINGHYEELDVASWDQCRYVFSVKDIREDFFTILWRCKHCGELAAWTNEYSIWWQENDMKNINGGYEGPVELECAEPPRYNIPISHGRLENRKAQGEENAYED
jgi:hypothetical protein